MGRRIVASLFLVLGIGLLAHSAAQSQAPAGSQTTPAVTAPLHLYRPGLVDRTAALASAPVAALDWWGTLLCESFEGEFPGSAWVVQGNPAWGVTTFRSHGGNSSVYCAGGGSGGVSAPGPYPNNMDAWMIYGPFDLSQATDAEVEFSFWNDTEAEVDYLGLAVAPDGADWHGTAWSGDWVSDCFGWCQETFSLTNVEGLGNLCGRAFVWIAFLFQSDGDTQYEGSYVDDITLRALFPGMQPSATATPTPTDAATPTPTATATPTATPTPTPAGTHNDPIPAICDAIYSGNTAAYPSDVSDYGSCGSGMSGPEAVYVLNSSQPLASLELDFAGGTQRRLFLLAGHSGDTCLGSASMSQPLIVHDLAIGQYFIVVDGNAPGSYFFSLHCSAMGTPTPGRTATATPLSRGIYLPLALKSGPIALSRWPEPDLTGRQ